MKASDRWYSHIGYWGVVADLGGLWSLCVSCDWHKWSVGIDYTSIPRNGWWLTLRLPTFELSIHRDQP